MTTTLIKIVTEVSEATAQKTLKIIPQYVY